MDKLVVYYSIQGGDGCNCDEGFISISDPHMTHMCCYCFHSVTIRHSILPYNDSGGGRRNRGIYMDNEMILKLGRRRCENKITRSNW